MEKTTICVECDAAMDRDDAAFCPGCGHPVCPECQDEHRTECPEIHQIQFMDQVNRM